MFECLKDRLFIVFALDHYNPLGLIRSLGEQGIAPVFIAVRTKHDVGTESKYLSRCYRVESVEEGYRILMESYGNYPHSQLPFLLTCDDRTMGFLDERYEEIRNKFILFNAGKSGRITEYMDKKRILACAEKHGLKVLPSIVAHKGEIPENLQYPVITKSISPNVGGWKSDVHICHSEKELTEAYERIKAPTVLIQKYVEKKNEYCLDGFAADQGNLMFIATEVLYKYNIPGYYSPYMDVHNFKNKKLCSCLQEMTREIGFEGIYSIEFIIDQDDQYWFSEINFRNSTWSYAATVAGMPLPLLWAYAMLHRSLPEGAYHDIPEGFTAMVEPIDYAKRVREGNTPVEKWLFDFKNCNCPFYFSKDDPEPFYMVVNNWELMG